jgi:glycosyltransferase involved in cell wall biosynthesis
MPACTDVAVVIPARDEGARIAATVTAAASLSDLVVVVDDASRDGTAHLAREAGARVVSRSRSSGKAAAMMAGARAVAAYEAENSSSAPRHLLFLDADLEHTAGEAWKLVAPVREGSADMTIAVLPAQKMVGGGHGLVVRLSKAGIGHLTGFRPAQPLSGMRCISRQAFDAVQPLARGWGVETALTVDILRKGYRITEVPAGFHHRVTGRGFGARIHRANQFRDVAVALGARYVRRQSQLPDLRS